MVCTKKNGTVKKYKLARKTVNQVPSSDGTEWNTATSFSTTSTTGALRGITYGNGKFIILTEKGYISTSTDGETWTSLTVNSTLNAASTMWTDIVYGNGKFIATESRHDTKLASSTDGVTWTVYDKDSNIKSYGFSKFCFDGTKFIILTTNRCISTSTDGVTWTQRVSVSGHDCYGIAYGNGKYIVSSFSTYVSTSTDCINWTKDITAPTYWRCLFYQDGKFIGITYNGYIYTSIDGVTWSNGTYNSNLGNHDWRSCANNGYYQVVIGDGYIAKSVLNTTKQETQTKTYTLARKTLEPCSDGTEWNVAVQNSNINSMSVLGITYGNGKFAAIGDTGVSTSTDGVNWTTPSRVGPLNGLRGITYGNEKFVAMSQMGYIGTSTDCETWSIVNTQLNVYDWENISYCIDKFILISSSGKTSTSSNGVNWTTPVQSLGTGASYQNLVYGNGKFVAIGYAGGIATSTDFVTWSGRSIPNSTSNDGWRGLAYNSTKFVALGGEGKISTSTDGTTWTTATQNSNLGNKDWRGLTSDGIKFVAIGYAGHISTSTINATRSIIKRYI